MSDLSELYQQLIIDHNNNPANFGALADHTHHAEGYNPLCGDRISIDLLVENDLITDIRFQGEGCAIAKSSASIMTTMVKGKSKENALELFSDFHDPVTQESSQEKHLGKLLVFSGVRQFPARVKCASLAWHTLKSALDKGEVVSTE